MNSSVGPVGRHAATSGWNTSDRSLIGAGVLIGGTPGVGDGATLAGAVTSVVDGGALVATVGDGALRLAVLPMSKNARPSDAMRMNRAYEKGRDLSRPKQHAPCTSERSVTAR